MAVRRVPGNPIFAVGLFQSGRPGTVNFGPMTDRRPHDAFSGVIKQVMFINQFVGGNQAVPPPAPHPFDLKIQVPNFKMGTAPAFREAFQGWVPL